MKLAQETSKIQLFNILDKNPNSSNGFNPFNSDEEAINKEESEKDTLKLFA